MSKVLGFFFQMPQKVYEVESKICRGFYLFQNVNGIADRKDSRLNITGWDCI